jgi:deoxycytidine triphosphate deaminase
MRTLVVIVGVRGAGKSCLLRTARNMKGVRILQPSTTDGSRSDEDDDYHFLPKDRWNDADYAWRFSVNGEWYGMRKAQIEETHDDEIGITQSHPDSIGELRRYAASIDTEVVTVGLDTIAPPDQQRSRTTYSGMSSEDAQAFLRQREVVRDCDIVLSGDQRAVERAFMSCVKLVKNRGVLIKADIEAFIAAGTLLTDADPKNIQPASYDLCLGSTVWCKGKTLTLGENDAVTIPPYSYVIVQAHEEAHLPKFVVAHYDLRVSLFIQGVLLSNGPQVDPGYRGALLCMLFNGSDSNVGIRRGEHFATIEFLATSRTTEGYEAQYQAKEKLTEFMQSSVAVGPGGTILDKFARLEGRWEGFRNVAIGVLVALFFGVVGVSSGLLKWAHDSWQRVDEAATRLEDKEREIDSLMLRLETRASGGASVPPMQPPSIALTGHAASTKNAATSNVVEKVNLGRVDSCSTLAPAATKKPRSFKDVPRSESTPR